ncbi:unnamed protein product [Paramecium sonneborni]|uniref:Uncharacterized protein n=1 Tax=Paramecium sonneborni TaxID=65129 RepID=A0A8S1QX39_9CILI|nr:unnamed protein product [Paramecium sonneborni]
MNFRQVIDYQKKKDFLNAYNSINREKLYELIVKRM